MSNNARYSNRCHGCGRYFEEPFHGHLLLDEMRDKCWECRQWDRLQESINTLESGIKKELSPVVYALSRALRWVNRKLSRVHGK
jgi:hypothetical protein